METWPSQGSHGGFAARVLVGREEKTSPGSPPPPSPSPGGSYHQLQSLVEEPIALAVQVGVGAACFGHTDPGKAGLL